MPRGRLRVQSHCNSCSMWSVRHFADAPSFSILPISYFVLIWHPRRFLPSRRLPQARRPGAPLIEEHLKLFLGDTGRCGSDRHVVNRAIFGGRIGRRARNGWLFPISTRVLIFIQLRGKQYQYRVAERWGLDSLWQINDNWIGYLKVATVWQRLLNFFSTVGCFYICLANGIKRNRFAHLWNKMGIKCSRLKARSPLSQILAVSVICWRWLGKFYHLRVWHLGFSPVNFEVSQRPI